jgi:4'-phosphopantetheinyl transferase
VSLHYAAVPAQRWTALERAWLARLPPAKSAAVARLREAPDRSASLVGIALLELSLRALGAPFDPLALNFPRHGKPHLVDGPDFSISHSSGLVACAVAASGRVGVDLERAGSVRAATARRVVGPVELDPLAGDALTPTDVWVMKEAVVKLAGRGIGALASVHLSAGRARLDGAEIWLAPLALDPEFVAWLAHDCRSADISTQQIQAADIAPLPEPA